jgi:2-(1,2-epoxy-1,2-dihydrophenyl)acetyl-CoA isomerase
MSSILFEIRDQLAIIKFNRPEKLNAFNYEMGKAFLERLSECGSSEEIRGVYVTGMGKGFSAGQDLAEVTAAGGSSVANMLTEVYNPIVNSIRNLNKPVIAAVNGVAAGAGANIALCCDIVLASQSASFIQAFSKIGLVPDSGGTFFLPRLIGWQKASALFMLGEKLSALEAERWGMIYRVFPDETFEQSSMEMGKNLVSMPTKALALIKHALNSSFLNPLETQLSLENDLQQKASGTFDHKEGIQAFLEKRQPKFKGA